MVDKTVEELLKEALDSGFEKVLICGVKNGYVEFTGSNIGLIEKIGIFDITKTGIIQTEWLGLEKRPEYIKFYLGDKKNAD